MASLQLCPLSEHFDEDEISQLEVLLAEAGAAPLDIDEAGETRFVGSNLDDSLFAEMVDRLDVNDVGCEIFVPPQFDEVFELKGQKIGSSHALLDVLDQLREELLIPDDEVEDSPLDDDDDDAPLDDDDEFADDFEDDDVGADEPESIELRDKELQHVWKSMYQGAKASIAEGLCLFLKP